MIRVPNAPASPDSSTTPCGVNSFRFTPPARQVTNVLRVVCVTAYDKMKAAWLTTPQQEGVAFFPLSLSVYNYTSSSTNIISKFW